jgi:hypothetical protein
MTLTPEALQRATQAKSDQLNSCDILGGSLVAKVLDVKSGSSEQPVIIVIDSWPQPWKPSKTSLRVLCACWGNDPQQWIGRYAVLFCDETVKFGGEAIGGIRTSHLSHISGTKKVAVNTTRGKKGIQTVEPYYPQDEALPVRAEPIFWPDDAFAKRLAAAQAKIDNGELTVETFIATLEKKAPLTVGQKARVKPTPVQVEPEPDPSQMIGDDDDPFGDPPPMDE